MLRKVAAAATLILAASPALAQQMTAPPPGYTMSAPNSVPAQSAGAASSAFGDFTVETGLRYSLSSGSTRYTLNEFNSGSPSVSQLSWTDMTSNAGEIFGRIDHKSGFFMKGYAGLSAPLNLGSMQDEDFPPITSPYSSTQSSNRGGKLDYGTLDFGYTFLRSHDAALGAFLGWQFYDQTTSAYGCTQVATSGICAPALPSSVLGITDHEQWNAIRIGLDWKYFFSDRLRATGDLAILPGAWMTGSDTHWLRIGAANGDFNGPTPVNATGYGAHVEAKLDYAITNQWLVGVGARYQYMTGDGTMHFEQSVVGGATAGQDVKWYNERYGAFLETAVRF